MKPVYTKSSFLVTCNLFNESGKYDMHRLIRLFVTPFAEMLVYKKRELQHCYYKIGLEKVVI